MNLNPSAFETCNAVFDPEGFLVPRLWHGNVEKWRKQPDSVKRKYSALEAEEIAKPEKAKREPRPYQKRFSTDYAIEWGRKQGWKLIERERFDVRTKRHHDLEGGVDAIFDDMATGRVGVQGAGRGERKTHFQRFTDWGGAQKAQRRNLKIFYLEFERGSKIPLLVEQWA